MLANQRFRTYPRSMTTDTIAVPVAALARMTYPCARCKDGKRTIDCRDDQCQSPEHVRTVDCDSPWHLLSADVQAAVIAHRRG
jgi:hypothetical protein